MNGPAESNAETKRLAEEANQHRTWSRWDPYRNRETAHDGLPGSEGTFSMCSFWFVECLARSGDLQKARFFFEKALGHANHLGLYAEEIGPLGTQLGNFPQAFTHLALISGAWNLDQRLP